MFYDLYLDHSSASVVVVGEFCHFFGPLEIYFGIKFLVSNICFLAHIKVLINYVYFKILNFWCVWTTLGVGCQGFLVLNIFYWLICKPLNWVLSKFGFMHEFWTISTIIVAYTRSKNYTNMVVFEHEIQTFEIMVVVLLFLLLLFDIFVPHMHIPYHFWRSGSSKYTQM